MTDEQLYAELQRFVDAANELTRSIRQGRGTLGKLLNDPEDGRTRSKRRSRTSRT